MHRSPPFVEHRSIMVGWHNVTPTCAARCQELLAALCARVTEGVAEARAVAIQRPVEHLIMFPANLSVPLGPLHDVNTMMGC